MALLVRGVIAPGLMPDIKLTTEGGFGLVICSAGGAKALTQLPGSTPDGDQQSGDLCPFATLGQPAALIELVTLSGEAWQHATEPKVPRNASAASAVATLGARGPPSLS